MQELYDVQSLYGVMQWICMPPILFIYIFSCTDVQYSTVHQCMTANFRHQVPGPVKGRIYSVPDSHPMELHYSILNLICFVRYIFHFYVVLF